MSTQVAVVPKELETRVSSAKEAADAIAITDQASYEVACRFVLDRINPVIKELENTFDPVIEAAHKTHKEALAQKNRHLVPLLDAKAIASRKCKDYEIRQEQIRQEEQRRLEEESRKREEEERLQEAIAAEEAGAQPDEVEAVLETPLPATTVKATTTFERVKGVTRDRPYSARVENKLALLRYVAQNTQFLNLVEPNMPALNAMARAQQNLMNIPGVKAGRF